MPGQGVIVGVGRIDYPAEFQGADERHLSVARRQQGRHDHQHLRPPHHPGRRERDVPERVSTSCCSASTGSTRTCSTRLGVPYEAVKWRPDVNPIDREEAMLHKQMQVATLIRVTASAATSSPTSTRCAGRSRRCPTSSTRRRTG